MRIWATRDMGDGRIYLWRTEPELINGRWMRGETSDLPHSRSCSARPSRKGRK